jgi:non-specific serine/threonine protein kinase/serine/threonine-protein kinase
MGEVFRAQQEEPIRRQVALKLIKTGMDTRQVVARFESERQALAMMNHPNIARVFDAGATERGRPYFVMEYVPGVPITEFCDNRRLTTNERLRLFLDVCAGVQHAHQKGIIHRDIKPSNVLVGFADGKPVPKIIDFGVARATEQQLTETSLHTQLGVLIGTPDYMSPEQAATSSLDIDTRSDVYSLGVMLYELLVGALPFEPGRLHRAAIDEVCRLIRQEVPPTPSTRMSTLGAAATESARRRHTDPASLVRELRGDLDWITMKALEKDRTRRYSTPTELAADIERHLRHEPVVAGKPSATYRARKFIERHWVGVGFASLLVVVLVGSSALLALEASRTARERDRANEEANSTEQVSEFLVSLFEVSDPGEAKGRTVTVREVLDRGMNRIATRLEEQPRVRERLRRTIGRVYRNLGLWERSAQLLERALSQQRELLGNDHPDTLSTMNDLAAVYVFQRRLADAEILYRESLATRRLLGPHRIDTLQTQNALADVYIGHKRYVEAESLLVEALGGLRQALGDDDPRTRAAMRTLGRVYRLQDKLDDASPLLQQLFDADRKADGKWHPETLDTMFELAELYRQQHRYSEAEHLFRETIGTRGQVLGIDHPKTFEAIEGLAYMLAQLGRWEEAEALHHDALDASRRIMDTEKPLTPDTENRYALKMAAFARLLTMQDRDREAERFYLDALEIQRRVIGDDHPDTLYSLRELAALYETQDREAEAEALYRDTLERSRQVLSDARLVKPGTENRLAWKQYQLARLCAKRGRLDEAEELYSESLDVRLRLLGDEHPATLATTDALAELYKKLGRYDDAEAMYLRVYETFARVLGEHDRNTARSLYHLAGLSALRGRREEALDYLHGAVSTGVLSDPDVLLRNPDFEQFRDDPGFVAVVGESARR